MYHPALGQSRRTAELLPVLSPPSKTGIASDLMPGCRTRRKRGDKHRLADPVVYLVVLGPEKCRCPVADPGRSVPCRPVEIFGHRMRRCFRERACSTKILKSSSRTSGRSSPDDGSTARFLRRRRDRDHSPAGRKYAPASANASRLSATPSRASARQKFRLVFTDLAALGALEISISARRILALRPLRPRPPNLRFKIAAIAELAGELRAGRDNANLVIGQPGVEQRHHYSEAMRERSCPSLSIFPCMAG